MQQGLLFRFLCVVLLQWVTNGQAMERECNWDMQCEELYTLGSKCLDSGKCSNPYAAGCLNNFYTRTAKWDDIELPSKRVCNSDDSSSDNSDHELCDPSPLNYTEIRVHNGDWESPMFYSWIIQIFLSEFLHVPVTIGLSEDTAKASFYNPLSEMSWSSQAYAFEHLLTANKFEGRCDLTKEPCAHVMPEVWIGQEKKWKNYLTEGHIDQVNGDGQVGKISWYIPVHTAKRHPQVASYHGMTGQREMLASIFQRPTSWGDYCEQISATNCTQADEFAERPPTPDEEDYYFLSGTYRGFFRPTEDNDCDANPDTCTGHIVGAPCTWSTNIDAQTYHNDIALRSNGPDMENGGYSYGQMIQIWRAANATQSHVVMWWWTPDATIEEFRDTPFQFQQVLLPEPTSECREARIDPEDRCNADPVVRRGETDGGCDNESNSLQKVLASSLRDLTFNTPEVDRSPGYQGILNLKVNHLDMNVMLQQWVDGGRTGHAARAAVCDYVVEHQSELESFVPRGYPRVFLEDTSYKIPLLFTAVGVAVFAIIYIIVISILVYWFSDTKVFVYAQAPFIFMVLLGLLLVACGSLFYALEPQTGICTSQVWFITLGYTLELVPLLVKVAAINRLMAASKRMRRVRISLRSLFCTVASLVILVVIFLTLWSILDAPKRVEGRYLLDDSDIVTTVSCSSESEVWSLMVICWNGVLIVCATVLAFQSRNIKQEFNDSRSLGIMIYSHFVFGVLRAVTFNLGGNDSGGFPSIEPSTAAAASSFLLSVDAITAVTIYILPKLEAARKAPQPHAVGTNNLSSTTNYNRTDRHRSHDGSVRSKRISFAHQSDSDRDSSSKGRRSFPGPMPSIHEGEDADDPSSSFDGSGSGDLRRSGLQLRADDDADESSSSDEADCGGPRFARTSIQSTKSEDANWGRPRIPFLRRSLDQDMDLHKPIVAPNVSILSVSGIEPIDEGSESCHFNEELAGTDEEDKEADIGDSGERLSDTPTEGSPESV